MKDKIANIRLTLHDGEPLIGIETMSLGRKFIFNHPMIYANTCELNENSIINTINDVIKNFNIDMNVVNYYRERNSYINYDITIRLLYNIIDTYETLKIDATKYNCLSKNQDVKITTKKHNYIDYIVIKSLQDNSTPGITFEIDLEENHKYYITLFGHSSNITSIYCSNDIEIISNENQSLRSYYSPSQIFFKSSKKSKYKFLINFNYPRLNEEIYIEKILVNKVVNYKKIVCISYSAGYFAEYLSKILNGIYIDKTNNNIFIDDNKCNTFIKEHKNSFLLIVGIYHINKWKTQFLYKKIFNNIKKIVIYFSGYDIKQLIDMEPYEKAEVIDYINNKNIIFASESESMNKLVKDKLNIDTTIIPMPIKNKSILKNSFNFPKDTLHIGIYMPNSRKYFFNINIILDVILKCPMYKFYFYCNGGYKITSEDIQYKNIKYITSAVDICKIYNDINCGIRVTDFDGEPQGGVELMMLGKYFIHNHRMKYAFYVGDNNGTYVNNIIEILNKLYKKLEINKESSEYYKERNSNLNGVI